MPEPRAPSSGLISTRSTATPASARWMAVAAPARPLPTTRTLFTAGIGALLLDGDGGDRGADGTCHGERSGGGPEGVAAGGGAGGSGGGGGPPLPRGQAHGWGGGLVARLGCGVAPLWAHPP